ncbi:uncharacterized protein LOC131215089 [Anopheles bellator]|uniref:uncharacterized protein LOC131215089 n=1 Tax=Anopheles bellator TaxID=139047 RepID=UPI0026497E2E|nr:uncharacterized protein LOC131215089 [Anopheles bellator]
MFRLAGTVLALCSVALVSPLDDTYNIELKQKDAEVYHEQSFGRNEFSYGYQVEKTNSQFQHKVKGPDDVTYGCYGYIDPDGEKHLVYYIADRLGYRLLAPDQPTKVFTDRVANSVNKLDAELQGRKLDEKVVAWNDLYLPATCRRLDEIVSITPPPTPPPTPKATTVPSYGTNSIRPVRTERPLTENSIDSFGGIQVNTGPSASDIGSSSGSLVEEAPVKVLLPTDIDENGTLGAASGDVPEPAKDVPKSAIGVIGINQGGSIDVSRSEVLDNAIVSLSTAANTSPEANLIEPVGPFGKGPPTTKPQPNIAGQNRPNLQRQAPDSGCGGPGTPADRESPRPKFPSPMGQFNGFVFPINRNCDASGRNTEQLLAQMQTINELVLQVSETLHRLIGDDRNRTTAGSDTCGRVLELLNIQQPVPLLVYVPIMLPYLDGGIKGAEPGGTTPPKLLINPASYAYAKTCSECK